MTDPTFQRIKVAASVSTSRRMRTISSNIGLRRHERGRDLHHRVAAVVRAADEASLKQGFREEAEQEPSS